MNGYVQYESPASTVEDKTERIENGQQAVLQLNSGILSSLDLLNSGELRNYNAAVSMLGAPQYKALKED